MKQDSLSMFTSTLQDAWGPLDSDLVTTCRRALAKLTYTDEAEKWLNELVREKPLSKELYRDPVRGFVLLAHAEAPGLYRPPHDHGRAWVVYGVQSGALEIRTYARVTTLEGLPRLVLRDETVLRQGEARAYLPGDIHDTRCLGKTALLFRFTERDLRIEDQFERRVVRYTEYGSTLNAPVT